MRRSALLAAAALALAGCPIPQPLPDYPAGTITPPRILVHTVQPASESVIRVGADCLADPAGEPSFEMGAELFDSITLEQVVARWFVNYDSNDVPSTTPYGESRVVSAPNSTSFYRLHDDGPFGVGSPFSPYDFPPPKGTGTRMGAPYDEAGTVRVVELLVSNSFATGASYREPTPNFEVQVQRWVFLLVPGAENCGPHAIVR